MNRALYAYAVMGPGTLVTTMTPVAPGVALPERLMTRRSVRLSWPVHEGVGGLDVPVRSMELDELGVRGWLLFGGAEEWCDVPWSAVTRVRELEVGLVQRALNPSAPRAQSTDTDAHYAPMSARTAGEWRNWYLAEEARISHAQTLADLALRQRPVPGDAVRYVGPGSCLHSTSRTRWVVQECACELCAMGRHVAVDELYNGLPRHIATAAVTVDGDIDQVGASRWARLLSTADAGARACASSGVEGVVAEHLYSLAMVSVGAEPGP